MNQRHPLTRMGFLLAGGKSSRMGENKAFLNFGGQTLLVRALDVLRAVCGTAVIVGDPVTFADHGPVIGDIFPDCGPLAGIHAALSHSSAELNLMLAVDTPFVSQALLDFMLRVAEENANSIVTVPRTNRGLQPLCAVYRREFLTTAEEALKAGKYKIDKTFADVHLRVISESELAAAGFLEREFFNVNTPDDRRAANGLSPMP